jgi:hypothetical protein
LVALIVALGLAVGFVLGVYASTKDRDRREDELLTKLTDARAECANLARRYEIREPRLVRRPGQWASALRKGGTGL